VLPRVAARCGWPYGLLVDQRLKLLSDLEVERHDPLIELPLAAIGTFGREIKVFLRIAENINEPSSFGRTTEPQDCPMMPPGLPRRL